MAVIFPRWTNYLPQLSFVGAVGGLLFSVVVVWYWFSPKFTDVGYAPDQPIAFTHKTHAGELGMDCRYCHTTVERAAAAAVPSMTVCMNCHKFVGKDQTKPSFEPSEKLRKMYDSKQTIEWTRVHLMPEYAYFDHSVHMAAAIGCVSCHGRVDTMEKVTQVQPLSMSWCLECHRDPAPNLRPREEITNMSWTPEDFDPQVLTAVRGDRDVQAPEHCSGCHR